MELTSLKGTLLYWMSSKSFKRPGLPLAPGLRWLSESFLFAGGQITGSESGLLLPASIELQQNSCTSMYMHGVQAP
jgi:hypothetical protein